MYNKLSNYFLNRKILWGRCGESFGVRFCLHLYLLSPQQDFQHFFFALVVANIFKNNKILNVS